MFLISPFFLKNSFSLQVRGGLIHFADIDTKYAISFVFKGDYARHLVDSEGNNLKEHGPFFLECKPDYVYQLDIVPDEDSISNSDGGNQKRIFKASTTIQDDNDSLHLHNQAHQNLTKELKNLSAEEMQEGSEKYKSLLEARELEDCLYG